jgi:hypothetical protein
MKEFTWTVSGMSPSYSSRRIFKVKSGPHLMGRPLTRGLSWVSLMPGIPYQSTAGWRLAAHRVNFVIYLVLKKKTP